MPMPFRKRLGRFHKEHPLLIDLLLVALILRLAYLNAVATPVFDESFYVPAAQQILTTGVDPNVEHPPLVKLILAGSIALFGDSPLAWRLPSVIAGLASIAVFYFIALELSKGKKTAALAAALLAFDPLHTVLSRTAMLDIFMLAFALGGCHFMLKRNWVLAGLLFGLGFASKWPAILPFLAASAFLFLRKKLKPLDFGYVLIIVGLVYLLAYTPFIIVQGPSQWLSSQSYYIGKMTTMPAANSITSTAAQWLYLQKPVWFARDKPDFHVPADMMWLADLFGAAPGFGIVAFGNPVSWIPGMFALAWMAVRKAKKISGMKLFSLLWFGCTYLPFLLIPRTHTAFYYMLLIIPSYFLALSQFLAEKKVEKLFLIAFTLSLLLFLPLVIGLPAPQNYYQLLKPLVGEYVP